jgi:alcohol dehydrogenase
MKEKLESIKMDDTMKAMVYRGPGRYGLEDVSGARHPGPDDVIGRVTLSSISGSDVHIVHGGLPEVRTPLIVGPNSALKLMEVGPAVKSLYVGDRVVVSCVAFCGNAVLQTGPPCPLRKGGVRSFGMNGPDGGQAEYVRLPGADRYCFKIPNP